VAHTSSSEVASYCGALIKVLLPFTGWTA